jgi:hypothetical protein
MSFDPSRPQRFRLRDHRAQGHRDRRRRYSRPRGDRAPGRQEARRALRIRAEPEPLTLSLKAVSSCSVRLGGDKRHIRLGDLVPQSALPSDCPLDPSLGKGPPAIPQAALPLISRSLPRPSGLQDKPASRDHWNRNNDISSLERVPIQTALPARGRSALLRRLAFHTSAASKIARPKSLLGAGPSAARHLCRGSKG